MSWRLRVCCSGCIPRSSGWILSQFKRGVGLNDGFALADKWSEECLDLGVEVVFDGLRGLSLLVVASAGYALARRCQHAALVVGDCDTVRVQTFDAAGDEVDNGLDLLGRECAVPVPVLTRTDAVGFWLSVEKTSVCGITR